ncbi:MAG: acetyl-CoA carboxylase carboxyltransferase subunit alpha [Gammaproteobacteria bacterium]|nr:acetyl-CoA carboxylase carboxyltransferase subunit alpha [Gammaproteobacteria bacterium]MXY65953.1 acetyl-CoA carboxylase carboxyltransferase subunit alpha [Gammaproteobacteria bacterium]MYG66946.1 acetyl-CoA carboxylase carboxyltransferase subunit alpha [Gammaproteobacteria bacterium]MYH90142.1 acetyl-CoA carboxylase carboxyltransferase subunit alpha [Gammaproteobacteria bacterium]
MDYLDFEKPIAELEEKIIELQRVGADRSLDLDEEIERMREKNRELTEDIFSKLTPWQVTQIARHPLRPYTLDYVERMCTDFQELHGDRMYSDDAAIVAGMCRIGGRSVALIGHQKGRDTRERTRRNFGMPRPEGYRKAQRVMQLADRFHLPVVTLIDTSGAYPGVGAEERGQSEAIARSLEVMASLNVPVVSVVIGEGGSGGALAIGVCDRLLMMEYAVYSVISPEGCASILWKSAEKAADAAEAMKMTTGELRAQGLVDKVIPEPSGGAHRDYDAASRSVASAVSAALDQLCDRPMDVLLEQRYQRLMKLGKYGVKGH